MARIVMEIKGFIEEHLDEMIEKGLVKGGHISNKLANPDEILKQMGMEHLIGKVNLKVVREDRPENSSRRDLNKVKRLKKKGRKAKSPFDYSEVYREVIFDVRSRRKNLQGIIDYLLENDFEYKV